MHAKAGGWCRYGRRAEARGMVTCENGSWPVKTTAHYLPKAAARCKTGGCYSFCLGYCNGCANVRARAAAVVRAVVYGRGRGDGGMPQLPLEASRTSEGVNRRGCTGAAGCASVSGSHHRQHRLPSVGFCGHHGSGTSTADGGRSGTERVGPMHAVGGRAACSRCAAWCKSQSRWTGDMGCSRCSGAGGCCCSRRCCGLQQVAGGGVGGRNRGRRRRRPNHDRLVPGKAACPGAAGTRHLCAMLLQINDVWVAAQPSSCGAAAGAVVDSLYSLGDADTLAARVV